MLRFVIHVKTWFNSQFEHGEEILRWAQELNDSVCNSDRLDEATLHNPACDKEILVLSTHLHVGLTALVRGTALAMVKDSCKGETMGLDGRRRLCNEFDPRTARSNRSLLKRLTHPGQISLGYLRRSIEEWGRTSKSIKTGLRKSWMMTKSV